MSVTSPPLITALPPPPDPNNRSTFNTLAYPWSVAQQTFATQVGAVASNVYNNATDAAISASTASTGAGTATSGADTATTKAGEALASAISASEAFDSFDERYLGAKPSDPSVDNNGNPLIVGATYWSTSSNLIMGWTGTQWVPGFIAAGSEVFGPASATDGHVTVFDGTSGKLIKSSGVSLSSKQDVLVSGTNIKTINSTTLLGSGDIAISTSMTYESRTTNTIFAAADKAKVIRYTTGSFTQTFTAAATLGAGWFIYLQNTSTTDVTLDPNASETIDGVTSGVLKPGMTLLVTCTGTAFQCVRVDSGNAVIEVKTSGTSWTCPLGVRSAEVTVLGGGGRASTAAAGGGAGGAAVRAFSLTPGTAYTYAVGAAAGDAGATGGNSTFSAGGLVITGAGGGTTDGGAGTNGDINLTGCTGTLAAPYVGGAAPLGLGFGSITNQTKNAIGYGAGGSQSYTAAPGVVIIKY